ncbi:hypothetical protein JCM8547_002945 [Rhodosporidiobolus lusitaniae]
MAAPFDRRTSTWDDEDGTPVVSPAPSAAVSRSPTLVDLHSHGLDAALAEADSPSHKKEKKLDGEQDGAEQHHHHFHLPHPPPHQHLEQYYSPEHYGSQDTVEREKEEARRAAGDEASAAEKSGRDGREEIASAPTAAANDYPDGGWRAWLVVAGAWAVSFTAWGYPNSFGVILTYTKQNQLSAYSSSSIAWIGAFQLFSNMFFGLLSGRLFDAGYVKHLLVAGLLCYTAGLFGLSYASTYWQVFLSQGLACGVASGLTFLPACSAVSQHFKKKRMLALGFLATGSSLGGVMYPSMINKLLHTPSIGFGWTFRIVGFINLALLIFACLTIKARLPPRPKGRFVDFSIYRKDPLFSLYIVGAAFVWLGLYTPLFYTEEYALFHNVPEDIAFYSLSILNAASLFGRTIPNYFADRFGVFTLLVPFTTVSGILLFIWIAAIENTAGTVVWNIVYGFFQGSFVAMLPASVAALTEDMNSIGIRMAMAFLGQSVAALVGTPIAGYCISLHPGESGYVGAGVYSGCTVLVGVALLGLVRQMLVKRRGTQWV